LLNPDICKEISIEKKIVISVIRSKPVVLRCVWCQTFKSCLSFLKESPLLGGYFNRENIRIPAKKKVLKYKFFFNKNLKPARVGREPPRKKRVD
jgi:hypothetical protein